MRCKFHTPNPPAMEASPAAHVWHMVYQCSEVTLALRREHVVSGTKASSLFPKLF
jgi:hypothetical protein